MPNKLAPTQEIIAELRAGRMVILVDEEDRENEGDLVIAADHVSPEAINFMAKHGRGLICLTLTRERCQQINLPLMVRDKGRSFGPLHEPAVLEADASAYFVQPVTFHYRIGG